ncbi:hypothetical protein BH11BAC1_BH11BAC1_09680 [soil metagenome]
MKNYTSWLKAAGISQFIIAVIHAPTLFITSLPINESEKQLFTLMDTYQFDFGAGFHRTMSELTFVFSACFCLLYIFGGLINWHLLRKKTDTEIMKGVITINLIVFGICFVIIAKFAFLLPVILSGLIFMFLILSRAAIPKSI